MKVCMCDCCKRPRLAVSDSDVVLSRRQVQVLALADSGLCRKLIARRLGIADESVKTHLSVVFRKLGVRNTAAACAVARAGGVL